MSQLVVHFVVCVFSVKGHSFDRRRPNILAFLRSFARRRLKNWISVGDRITGLLTCMCTTETF